MMMDFFFYLIVWQIYVSLSLCVVLQLVDEEFDALEGFFYVLEHGILELLENVETYLHHLQVKWNENSDMSITFTWDSGNVIL